jgi:extracellular matrix protein 14
MLALMALSWLLTTAHAFSLPFSPVGQQVLQQQDFLLDSASIHESIATARTPDIEALNAQGTLHYSQLSHDEWPIPLDSYNDTIVLRLTLTTNTNTNTDYEKALASLHAAPNAAYSVWGSSKSHGFIDVQLHAEKIPALLQYLEESNVKVGAQLMVGDLAQTIFETFPQAQINTQSSDSTDNVEIAAELFFKSYRELDTIYAWYDLLVDSYPDILSIEYIGNTYEGRPMKALRLSVHSDSKADAIKTVVVTGGIHAREWISVSTSCYILYQLLQDYEAGKPSVKRYLENLDFLFLPVMNPDGYEFSWKNERLWRKNKQQTFNPRCQGIDIDHSFDFHFTSGFESPCSDDYPGEAAFEALESYNWDRYLNETKHSHPIYAYIDLHSYAEEVLYPYAYSCDILPRDEENLLELAYGLGQAIRLKSGKYYEIVKACQDKGADLLPSMGSGSALDYMYHNKAYWAFVLKLRDSGTRGFLLPPRFIKPVGKEIYASVKYFAAFLLSDNAQSIDFAEQEQSDIIF